MRKEGKIVAKIRRIGYNGIMDRMRTIRKDGQIDNMTEFFHALSRACPGRRNFALTALEGRFFGEKALVSEKEVVWRSKETGFFAGFDLSAEIEKQKNAQGCGVYSFAGTDVFCEELGQQKKMIVCGGGHVSIPLIQMGRMLGFFVCVLEDRPEFADRAGRAGASEVILEPFAQGLEKIKGDKDSYFVIVTRGHQYDQECLERIAKKEHAYIGMMGSKKRAAEVKKALLLRGADSKVINQAYTPIGLAIGAKTPEEIAVAVMAQIIQVKNKDERGGGFPKEIIDAALHESGQAKALATIVRRKGSAPREVGTKMLVRADGTCVGTIGGGILEAEIVKKARLLLLENKKGASMFYADMTGTDAGKEGMACGGKIDVLIEVF